MTLKVHNWYRGMFADCLRWLFIERIELRASGEYEIAFRVSGRRVPQQMLFLCPPSSDDAANFVHRLDRASEILREQERRRVVKTVEELEVRYR